jgi:hypothetical protein
MMSFTRGGGELTPTVRGKVLKRLPPLKQQPLVYLSAFCVAAKFGRPDFVPTAECFFLTDISIVVRAGC